LRAMGAISKGKPRTKRDRRARKTTIARRVPRATAAPPEPEPRASKPDGRITRAQLRAKLTAILRGFVPDFDPKTLKPDASLRQALAADSMDVLNLVVAIHDQLGVDIPEEDYGKIDTLDGCLDYLAAAIAAHPAGRPRPSAL